MPARFTPTMLAASALAALAIASMPAQATLVGGPDIIAAPTFATNAAVTNLHQQGFDERQGVLLGAALAVDGGSISSGTVVNSHMIFFNLPETVPSGSDVETWVFDGLILGVMSDSAGSLEAASTAFLGAPGTTYDAPFPARGLEPNDGYIVSGNTITVRMSVAQPGDWIRVVTAVPEPGSLALLGLALTTLGLRRRDER